MLTVVLCLCICGAQAGNQVQHYCEKMSESILGSNCILVGPTGRDFQGSRSWCTGQGHDLWRYFTKADIVGQLPQNTIYPSCTFCKVPTEIKWRFFGNTPRGPGRCPYLVRGWIYRIACKQTYNCIACSRRPDCGAGSQGSSCQFRCSCKGTELFCPEEGCDQCNDGFVGKFCNISVTAKKKPSSFFFCPVTTTNQDPIEYPELSVSYAEGEPFKNYPGAVKNWTASENGNYRHTWIQGYPYCDLAKSPTVVCKFKGTELMRAHFVAVIYPRLIMLSSYIVETLPVAFMCTLDIDPSCGALDQLTVDTGIDAKFFLDGAEVRPSNNVFMFHINFGRRILVYRNASTQLNTASLQCKIGTLGSNVINLAPHFLGDVILTTTQVEDKCKVISDPNNSTMKVASYEGACNKNQYSIGWFIKDEGGLIHRATKKILWTTQRVDCEHGAQKVTSNFSFQDNVVWAETYFPDIRGTTFTIYFVILSAKMYPCCDGQFPGNENPIPCEKPA